MFCYACYVMSRYLYVLECTVQESSCPSCHAISTCCSYHIPHSSMFCYDMAMGCGYLWILFCASKLTYVMSIVMSCHVMSCPVLSCPVMSCVVMSFHVMDVSVVVVSLIVPLHVNPLLERQDNNVRIDLNLLWMWNVIHNHVMVS